MPPFLLVSDSIQGHSHIQICMCEILSHIIHPCLCLSSSTPCCCIIVNLPSYRSQWLGCQLLRIGCLMLNVITNEHITSISKTMHSTLKESPMGGPRTCVEPVNGFPLSDYMNVVQQGGCSLYNVLCNVDPNLTVTVQKLSALNAECAQIVEEHKQQLHTKILVLSCGNFRLKDTPIVFEVDL